MITGIPMPVVDASRGHAPSLFAISMQGNSASGPAFASSSAYTVIQVTDLGVHAKIGATEGAVWVTGVHDGAPRAGATVVLHDAFGRDIATAQTNAEGLARFASFRTPPPRSEEHTSELQSPCN